MLGAVSGWALPFERSGALLFGLALPALAIVLLRPRGRDDLAAADRARGRLLSALVAGLSTIAVVAQLLVRDRPVLLGFGLVLPVVIAAAMPAARGRERFPAVRRRVRAGLLVALVSTLLGAVFVALRAVMETSTAVMATPAAVMGTPVPVLGASVAVALLLLPVHALVERLLDRWLHGPRTLPYRVLAVPSGHGAPDLDRVAEAVGQALNARTCRLTVHRSGRPDRIHRWPQPDAGPNAESALVTLPVGELGSIGVDRATGADGHRHRMLADIADGLVPVLEAHRLGVELERQLRAVQAHAAAIAASRRRLVAEMDAERRRIERDLHDGAQHHLVSLRLALGLAEHLAVKGTPAKVAAALDRVGTLIDDAEAVIARTATGVTSPALAAQGLVAALRSELEVDVVTSGDAAGRLPDDVAEAVWFCCLEAVGNARKYAPGAALRVSVSRAADRLVLGVHDDGPGWDMAAAPDSPSRGMRNVAERIRSLGGVLTVRSAPGEGTRVDGWVPLPDESLIAVVRAAVADHPAARTVGDRLDRAANGSHREQILAAAAALRDLDALIRDEGGPAALRHRLDRIRAGRHELAEVAAAESLRRMAAAEATKGPARGHLQVLPTAEITEAARLLGESGPDARSRLGLAPDADRALVRTDAERALTAWRARASHPATARDVREVAATVVRSCEHLLHQLPGA